MSSLSPASFDSRPFFSNLGRQHGFEDVPVTGRISQGLEGTLYRSGPGIIEQLGRRYDHLFEGDGAMTAVRISGGRAQLATRVLQTQGLVEEQAAGRHLGSFAASWPDRLRRIHGGGMKNTANTSPLHWQGRLFALMGGGKPTEVDPDTLACLGERDLGGVVPGAFSAHPCRVASRRCTYNFGLRYGKQTLLDLFALPDDGPARLLGSVPLAAPVMLHDFGATDNHLIFFISPVELVTWRMLLGLRPFQDMFRWTPSSGTEVIVVPIDNPAAVQRFRVDPFMQFHFAGAVEDRGELVVDYVRYPDSALLWALGSGAGLSLTDASSRAPGGRLHRARIDPVRHRFTSEPLWDGDCEFPRVIDTPGGGRRTWLQSEVVVDGVLRFQISRLDPDGQMHHHRLAPGAIASEPVPVGDDLVMTLVFDCARGKSRVLVLGAESLKPVAEIDLQQAIPITFHGVWVDGVRDRGA